MRHDELDDEPYIVIEKDSASVSSFLLGAAIGAGIALLFAPRSGLETRQAVGRRARDAQARARLAADDARANVTRRVSDARGAIEDRVDRARDAVDLRRRQVQRAVEAGRAAAVEARADLERRIAETKAAYQAGTTAARDALRPGDARAATTGLVADVTITDTSATLLDASGAPVAPSSGGSAKSTGA